MDFFEARYYAFSQGRFTSADSIGGSQLNPQTLNLYAYVKNNPLKFVDPTGHMAERPEVVRNLEEKRDRALVQAMQDASHYQELVADGIIQELFGNSALQGEPQDSSQNPNDLQNAVVGSPGLGRPFDAAPGPDGQVFHDGAHALSPANAANVVTLPALAGVVIYKNVQEYTTDSRGRQVPALYTVDVRPTIGNFIVVYKDLASVSVRNGQVLGAGDVIGTVRPAGDPKSYIGLHVALVRPGFYDAFRRETKTQAQQNRLGTVNTRRMFIDPLGPESPIRRRR